MSVVCIWIIQICNNLTIDIVRFNELFVSNNLCQHLVHKKSATARENPKKGFPWGTMELWFPVEKGLTVNWGDFGHFSNSTSCSSLLLLGMPLVLPGKLES